MAANRRSEWCRAELPVADPAYSGAQNSGRIVSAASPDCGGREGQCHLPAASSQPNNGSGPIATAAGVVAIAAINLLEPELGVPLDFALGVQGLADGVPSAGRAGALGTADSTATSSQQGVRVAGSDVRHVNGAIAETRGYHAALDSGQMGIQRPGKVTSPGPDFITYDPQSKFIIVWDAKYRVSGTGYPTSLSATTLRQWIPDVRDAINALPEGPFKWQVSNALESGRVSGSIFRWPPK